MNIKVFQFKILFITIFIYILIFSIFYLNSAHHIFVKIYIISMNEIIKWFVAISQNENDINCKKENTTRIRGNSENIYIYETFEINEMNEKSEIIEDSKINENEENNWIIDCNDLENENNNNCIEIIEYTLEYIENPDNCQAIFNKTCYSNCP